MRLIGLRNRARSCAPVRRGPSSTSFPGASRWIALTLKCWNRTCSCSRCSPAAGRTGCEEPRSAAPRECPLGIPSSCAALASRFMTRDSASRNRGYGAQTTPRARPARGVHLRHLERSERSPASRPRLMLGRFLLAALVEMTEGGIPSIRHFGPAWQLMHKLRRPKNATWGFAERDAKFVH